MRRAREDPAPETTHQSPTKMPQASHPRETRVHSKNYPRRHGEDPDVHQQSLICDFNPTLYPSPDLIASHLTGRWWTHSLTTMAYPPGEASALLSSCLFLRYVACFSLHCEAQKVGRSQVGRILTKGSRWLVVMIPNADCIHDLICITFGSRPVHQCSHGPRQCSPAAKCARVF